MELKEALVQLNQPNADHEHEGVGNAHPPLTSRPGHLRGEGQMEEVGHVQGELPEHVPGIF